ncbi:MAG: TonB-dependent receptor [Phenylobacterium sp.]|uniref:TonB-dependent receptor n=1 Tax=Phenylobacterium sp. TaxID=1871053 RepID=UPI002736B71F|nr:TonB-dependent receptor [Phenylobacterium sp.]MDP3747669.1 TonB-dependent receptor [Phenylobacterium sp.]
MTPREECSRIKIQQRVSNNDTTGKREMGTTIRRLLLATVALTAPLAAVPAFAEAGSSAPVDISEVIVTAQKRSESVQSVPASITALNAQTLQERGVNQVSDLRFMVPSMQVGKLVGNTNISIRGIGLNLVVAAGPPGVAIHVDGVYQPIAAMGDLAQIDLERVEVLRGPQGTLYGRNANAGVVNFITKAPTDEFEGYVQAGYATYDESRLQAVVNVPVNERVRARAVFDYMDRDKGFVKNVLPNGQDVIKGQVASGRLRVDADLTENLTLSLTAAVLESSGPWDSFTLRGIPTPPSFAGGLAPQEPRRTAVNTPTNTDINFTFGAATLSWDIGDFNLKSITGWQRHSYDHFGDDDGTSKALFLPYRNYLTTAFTQEFNVGGSLGPVDAVVGAFYMDFEQEVYIHFDFPLGLPPLPPNSQQQFEVRPLENSAIAAFADATWNVSDRLRLIGGIRVSKDKMTITQNNFLVFGVGAPQLITCANRTRTIEFNSTTPRVGAQYDLATNSNVYATYSKGFKVGGFNRNQCNLGYNPEKITAYEVGIKNRFFDNTVTLNASAFYYDYTDLQLAQQVGLAQQITNAAAARVKGLEVEGLWQPNSHWTFNASLSLLDAEYTDFLNVDPLAPALGLQDLSGNRLNDAPTESVNAGVSYRTGDLAFGRLTFRADMAQRTRIHFREFGGPLNEQSGYTILNLAMIWDSPDDKYRVRVYGSNVTDKEYITTLQGSQANGSRFTTWGAPRQVGVELRANF